MSSWWLRQYAVMSAPTTSLWVVGGLPCNSLSWLMRGLSRRKRMQASPLMSATRRITGAFLFFFVPMAYY